MAQRILGLDIGHVAVKGVVMETTLRSAKIVAYHTEPVTVTTENNEELARVAQQSAVRHLLEHIGPFDQVCTALTSDRQACSSLEMPFSDATKIDKTLPFQLDDITALEVDELLYDYQFIQKEKKGTSRILVGTVPRTEVGKFLQHIQDVGLDPRSLMMDGLPYHHLYDGWINPPEVSSWAILDLGEHHSTLVIFRRDDSEKTNPIRVELVRSIKRGTWHLQQALIQTFQFENQEAHEWLFDFLDLAPQASQTDPRVLECMNRALGPYLSEWRRTLGAMERRTSDTPKQLFLTGGGTYIHGFCEYLSQRLNLPTSRLELHQLSVAEGTHWTDQPYTYLKAVGLALHPAHSNPFARINLRQKEFSFKGDLQFLKERIKPILLGLLILFVLFCISIFTQFYARSVEGTRLRKEADSRCQEILGSKMSSSRCLSQMRYKILQAQGSSATALIPRVSARDVFFETYDRIAKLAKMRNFKVVINTWNIVEDRINIEGETDSFGAVGQIEQELKTFQCFQDLQKGKLQRQDTKVVFRIRARISC